MTPARGHAPVSTFIDTGTSPHDDFALVAALSRK
jgi:hypothetical protein